MIKEIILDGKKVKFIIKDKSEHIQKHWMGGGFYEAHRNGLLAYMYQRKDFYKNKTVLDIGACIGNHSLFFEKILGMKVKSIEPQPDNYKHLVDNIELNNSNVDSINVALGNHKGRVAMKYQDKNNIGMFQVAEGDETDIVTLDSLNLKADIIKIDVEHYNTPLLQGGKDTIKGAKQVFIECESDEILAETNVLMTQYGFKLQAVKLNHTPTYLWA